MAPAKLNLALHVRARRDDGYHELDTLFVFVRDGDDLRIVPADGDRFTITGPFASALDPAADNLVTRARDLFRREIAPAPPVAIELVKRLPVASGIGGGSADAAATLTAMCAAGVAEAMQHFPPLPDRVLVTGGGRHNPGLMRMLSVSLDCPVMPIEEIGLDGDMLEAQAFGYLAVRVARGLPTSCPGTTGVRAAVGGGTVSMPTEAISV